MFETLIEYSNLDTLCLLYKALESVHEDIVIDLYQPGESVPYVAAEEKLRVISSQIALNMATVLRMVVQKAIREKSEGKLLYQDDSWDDDTEEVLEEVLGEDYIQIEQRLARME